jgi:dihydroflavonol-4-reductase
MIKSGRLFLQQAGRNHSMKALIVGGTGLIGGWVAVELARQGIAAAIFARKCAPPGTPMATLPFIQGDYFGDEIDSGIFRGFDTLLFAACSDVRHYAPTRHGNLEAFYQRANVKGVPAFVRKARDGGIRRVVYIGTLYASLKPALTASDPYVESRLIVDQELRAMAASDFHVETLDIPYAIGGMQGLVPSTFRPIAEWALGRKPEVPLVAPDGGSNFMSLRSVARAVQGAMENKGENGCAYLLGDQNLSFRELCLMFFRAAGRSEELPVTQDEHPLLPDVMLPAGRGRWLRFDPDATAAVFQYERCGVEQAVRDLVAEVRRELSQ